MPNLLQVETPRGNLPRCDAARGHQALAVVQNENSLQIDAGGLFDISGGTHDIYGRIHNYGKFRVNVAWSTNGCVEVGSGAIDAEFESVTNRINVGDTGFVALGACCAKMLKG
ncbi:MAG: hypothetical protein HN341_19550 [Verrucomicrobia bacterium]|jgi:hypothetical protein|nr:hypothetical protein [Verrucomicrobiota bacterium]